MSWKAYLHLTLLSLALCHEDCSSDLDSGTLLLQTNVWASDHRADAQAAQSVQDAKLTTRDHALEVDQFMLKNFEPCGLSQLQTSQHVTQHRSGGQWGIVAVLAVLLLVAITPIIFTEGIKPFLIVVVYLACLSLVKMYVKETMNQGLECPDFITMLHMIATAGAACIVERPKLDEALSVLPISVVTGCSLILNNTALLHGGVAFTSMIACATPVFTFGLEFSRGKRSLDFAGLVPVLLVVVGAMLCVQGEKTAAMLAFLFASGATFFRAMKSVWQQELLTVQVSPLRLIFWSGFWSFLIMIPIVAVNEGTKGLTLLPGLSMQGKISLLLSAISACTLNVAQCYAVKALGALMQSLVGNLNLILVIALSQAWLHETVSIWQYTGVSLMVVGSILKNVGKKKAEGAKAPLEQPRFNPESAPEGNK
eukprot:TRINITY_DN26665_c0_g1_i1.p1 TRINITY_DN26665_c0_g1~~TRINITY_DN26665_c0_g1_i1.p1  ORF type:complete len:424 (+),score=63.86 TRINITY_DN26665_c0_g1_i1:100-1371(+)